MNLENYFKLLKDEDYSKSYSVIEDWIKDTATNKSHKKIKAKRRFNIMTTAEIFQPLINYGSFELKKTFQKNFAIGLTLSVMIHLFFISSYYIVQYLTKQSEEPIRMVRIMKYTDLGPPPSLTDNASSAPKVQVAGAVARPTVGIPVPVPDIDISPDQTIATQDEMSTMVNPSATTDGAATNIDVDIEIPKDVQVQVEDQAEPDMNGFVAVEKYPEIVHLEVPEYPEMAKKAGMEEQVLVKVLIDKEGKVKKAVVVKGYEIFHDAVIKAAMKCVFTPAIQNQKPVMVWIMLPFNFTLEEKY